MDERRIKHQTYWLSLTVSIAMHFIESENVLAHAQAL
jgi:hypothetical protein